MLNFFYFEMHTRMNPNKKLMLNFTKNSQMDFTVKKRDNQRQNEVLKEPVALIHIPLFYGDRFIPRRYYLRNLEFNLKLTAKNMEQDVLKQNFPPNYWKQHNFIATTNKIFRLEEKSLLSLSDPMQRFSLSQIYPGFDWQCNPRPKPMAFPETTHDSPGFESIFDRNMIDWSVNGHIIASFGQDVIIWKRFDDITMLFNVKNIKAVAYSPDGKFLAISCKSFEYPVLELWNVSYSTKFLVVNGKIFPSRQSDVQCIEWNQSGSQIICGTHLGTIYTLSVPELNILQKVRKHILPITILRLSPNSRYLASGDAEGNIVVYVWKSLEVFIVIRSRGKRNTDFTWHPWSGVELVIAVNVPASIEILHIPSKKIVAYYQKLSRECIINSVSFNKLTGELLVSISKRGIGGRLDFTILVMSSLNRVVDLLSIPEIGARFMMWSPDGTRLASSGKDGTLTIWNFCKEFKNKALRNCVLPNNDQKKPNILWDKFGTSFRSWSCIR